VEKRSIILAERGIEKVDMAGFVGKRVLTAWSRNNERTEIDEESLEGMNPFSYHGKWF
jgi:hypothetical protein